MGVFAHLWADTSVEESSRSMLGHFRFIPMSVFLADSSLLFMSLCVNVQQNRKCLQSLWKGTQEWRFVFMHEMKSAEGKGEIKGRGWIQERSLMWARLYAWCSGLSLFTTSCSKPAWKWLKEGFLRMQSAPGRMSDYQINWNKAPVCAYSQILNLALRYHSTFLQIFKPC